MNYAILANITAATHITIIILVLIGIPLSIRFKRFRPWEAGILISVIILWSYYGNCPLTIVEQYFHNLAGHDANLTSVGFLPYYANKLLGIGLSSKIVQNSTFFTGGIIFTASIEWLNPYVNLNFFFLRKSLKKLL